MYYTWPTVFGMGRHCITWIVRVVTIGALGALFGSGMFGAYSEPAHHLTPGTPDRPGLTLPTLDTDRFADCVDPDRFDGIPSGVVVVRQVGTVERMGLDSAWRRNNNREPADDVFVIGACR